MFDDERTEAFYTCLLDVCLYVVTSYIHDRLLYLLITESSQIRVLIHLFFHQPTSFPLSLRLSTYS
jgi:hypothetical protein